MAIEYRDVPEIPGYRIGSDGSVWSRRAHKTYGNKGGNVSCMSDAWHQVKPRQTDVYGYLSVSVKLEGKRITRRVHRLVLCAFVGSPPSPESHCRHLDGNPRNNRVENLVWGTGIENAKDKVLHGTQPYGEAVHTARLTQKQVRVIRELRRRHPGYSGMVAFLARWMGVSQGAITDICTGRTWR